MTIRYIAILILGFIMTYFIPGDLFEHPNIWVGLLMRLCAALIFLFLTWLLQPNPSEEKSE
ncbi:hypothetical protein [Jeotgalibacillus sp. JSM ZJ347]|uniref:hypothetical protein n=1 Tax=Jeotgalibacillus sp. JSM ZJ347 TaxID=3342117 RepID=UPI0035A93027